VRTLFLLLAAALVAAAAPGFALPLSHQAPVLRLGPALAAPLGVDARGAVLAALAVGLEDDDITLSGGPEPSLWYAVDLARVRTPCSDRAGCGPFAMAEVAPGL
jgi:hypothetical protein